MMKAFVCREFGPLDSHRVETVPRPKAPKRNYVVISVRSCGVNFPDTLIVQGKYQIKPPRPFSPGAEIAGVIKAVGENVVGYKVGQRVLAQAQTGGYAEEIVVHKTMLLPYPGDMSFEEASAFFLTYGTTLHALKDRAKLQAGETILILGASGGVGTAAIEISKAMGATVIAAASTTEKLEFCRQAGADHLINYTTENLKKKVKSLTKRKGVNVCYDPVGGAFLEPALKSMAWDGRYLVIGFASGDIPRVRANLILLKSINMLGVFWGSWLQQFPKEKAQHVKDLYALYSQGKIRPKITKRYTLAQSLQALRDFEERKVTGKVVIVMGGESKL